MISCNSLYTRSPLNRAYVASKLGLDVHVFSERLHVLKSAYGLRSDVAICLDDGEVYDPQTEESLGNLYRV
jgi:hypothetical protein